MRKLFVYLIIFFQILLIISLVQGIQISIKSQKRVSVLSATKQSLEQDRENLLKQYQYVQSPFYLEEVARDQLHMSKPGETVVIVPEGAVATPGASNQETGDSREQNWQKWWGVIVGG